MPFQELIQEVWDNYGSGLFLVSAIFLGVAFLADHIFGEKSVR